MTSLGKMSSFTFWEFQFIPARRREAASRREAALFIRNPQLQTKNLQAESPANIRTCSPPQHVALHNSKNDYPGATLFSEPWNPELETRNPKHKTRNPPGHDIFLHPPGAEARASSFFA
jgi:hypothetical protein